MNVTKESIEFVLKNEGGFNIDNGGPTNFGITAKYLMDNDRWQYDLDGDGIIGIEDMKKFSKENAITEYEIMFEEDHYNLLEDSIFELTKRLFDMRVNSGPSVANKLLQKAYNVNSEEEHKLICDGILGPKTISVINEFKDEYFLRDLIEDYREERIRFYESLVDRNAEKYGPSLKSWLRRANL
jgi:lysozyme family protein